MIVRGLAFWLALLAVASGAQVVVQEDIVTDSVDVFSTAEQKTGKSVGLAMAATIVLPGLGHQYLDRPQRALTYFTAEALIVFGAVFCERYSNRLFNDALAYAWKYAWVEGGPAADESFAQNLAHVERSSDYNRIMDNNRDHGRKYTDPDIQWVWPDESLMNEYSRKREWATTFHVASTFLVGTMVLNRVISFIDIRTSTRHKGVRSLALNSVSPTISPDLTTLGLSLNGSF